MTVNTQKKSEPESKPLKRLALLLNYLGFELEYLPVEGEQTFEALLIALDEPLDENDEAAETAEASAEKNFAYVAQIFFSEDLLQTEELPEIQAELARAVTLQFLVHTSLDASALMGEGLLKLYQFLTACNRILPLGHFDLDPDQQVFLHYSLRAEDRNLPANLIVDVLEHFGFFVNRCAPLIQGAIQSQTDLPELISHLETELAHAVHQYLPAEKKA